MPKQPAIYILASRPGGAIYIGVTSALRERVWEHKNGVSEGFARAYRIHRLVYFELYDDMESAIAREKQLKKWRRTWKVDLIEQSNPEWKDLWSGLG